LAKHKKVKASYETGRSDFSKGKKLAIKRGGLGRNVHPIVDEGILHKLAGLTWKTLGLEKGKVGLIVNQEHSSREIRRVQERIEG